MIKISNLNKYYNRNKSNEIHVINDISLELPSTGLVSFLGESGSGKTTLLNVIGGLDRAKGSIAYDELSIVNYNMRKIDKYRKEKIGYVFQNYNLLLNETIYTNLVVALELIGIYDKNEQDKRIERVLKAVGMYKYRKKKAYALSGGQQQRVSIARALVKNSKIIIADEPTGNLDRDNAIQVMNILKSVSKDTLVLLVTHNNELASFYSDLIFNIKDGRIIDSIVPSSNDSLNTASNNTIYLKDLDLSKVNEDNLDIDVYSDKDIETPLKLKIIYKNGTYYIDSEENIKLVNDDNIKLVDDHKKEIRKDEILNDIDYSSEDFEMVTKKPNFFKRLGSEIKQSFTNFRSQKKKTKIIYSSMTLIGVMASIFIAMLSNYVFIDTSSFEIDTNYTTLYNDSYYNTLQLREKIVDLSVNDKISNLNLKFFTEGVLKNRINFAESNNVWFDMPYISSVDLNDEEMIAGKLPTSRGEIVLSKGIVDKLKSNSITKIDSYESILGKEVDTNVSNIGDVTVVGVSSNPYIMSYVNDDDFLHLLSRQDQVNGYLPYRTLEKETINGERTYKILEGRDLTEEDYQHKVCLASKYSYKEIGSKIKIRNVEYEVVGIYEFKKYQNDTSYDEYILNAPSVELEKENHTYRPYDSRDIVLVDGRLPESNSELLVSTYSSSKIGQVKDGKIIVGTYNSDLETLFSDCLGTRDQFIAEISVRLGGLPIFKQADKEALKNALKGTHFEPLSLYDYSYKDAKSDQSTVIIIYGSISVVLLVTLMVLIYFIMRAKMISEIYSIGVYRSLGASKTTIIKKFLVDILVLVTLTSAIGYLLSTGFYLAIYNYINGIAGVTSFMSNGYVILLGFIMLYVSSVIFGLLPIILLLRKTPSEILSKYDI